MPIEAVFLHLPCNARCRPTCGILASRAHLNGTRRDWHSPQGDGRSPSCLTLGCCRRSLGGEAFRRLTLRRTSAPFTEAGMTGFRRVPPVNRAIGECSKLPHSCSSQYPSGSVQLLESCHLFLPHDSIPLLRRWPAASPPQSLLTSVAFPRRRSLLGHPRPAQTGEIGGLQQRADHRPAKRAHSPQTGDV